MDLFRDAPTVGDGDDVAFAQRGSWIVDKDAERLGEFLMRRRRVSVKTVSERGRKSEGGGGWYVRRKNELETHFSQSSTEHLIAYSCRHCLLHVSGLDDHGVELSIR